MTPNLKAAFHAIVVLAITCSSAIAQKPFDTTAVIKKQAELMANAFKQNDFKALAKTTYPAIVKSMGGSAKMEAYLQKGLKEMNARGISFQSVTIGQPGRSLIFNKETQCIVPETIIMKMPEGNLKSIGYLVAISADGGSTWYFVDSSGHNIEELRKMLPNLSPKLAIPARQKPVLLPN